MEWRRGQADSAHLRSRVLAAEGRARAVASRFKVSISYVIKARQRRDRAGELTTRPQRSHTPRLLAHLHAAIEADVRQHPDATLNELRVWLRDAHGVMPSMGLMWNTLDRLGLTLKKRSCVRPSNPARTSPPLGSAGAACNRG